MKTLALRFPDRPLRLTGCAVLALALACAASEGDSRSRAPSSPDPELPALVELALLAGGARPPLPERMPRDSPLWPQVTFLRAETELEAGRLKEAEAGYRALVEWAAGDPYGDGLGGSGLAIVALWRWVELRHAEGGRPGAETLAEILARLELLETRFAQRIFKFGFLDALPNLQAELLRKLSILCWRAGLAADAGRLFSTYLELASGGEPGPEERAMLESLFETGGLSRERIVELQARRLEELRRHEEALPLWRSLVASEDRRLGDLARLHVARLEARLFAADRRQIDRLLTAVIDRTADEWVAQEALLSRAAAWAREGAGQDFERANRDLTLVVDRYPTGHRADDALFRLASHHQRRYERSGETADLDRALELFARLRDLRGPNDWLESAHFQPAMALYSRGGRDNLSKASGLLRALLRRKAAGALGRAAAFWEGRMLEELGEGPAATAYFRQIVAARPYDYYALRSRMHLQEGSSAAGRLWPRPETAAELARDHREHPAYRTLTQGSAYHRRLSAAVSSGLYRRLLERRRDLRARRPGERLQNLSLDALDGPADLAAIALLLALRQDALAAAAWFEAPRNALEVHAAVGLRAGDLPLATSMALGSLPGGMPGARPDQDPRFLAGAYPPAFTEVFLGAARAESLPAELLYALARRESLFDPGAISTFSARGLFQFIPSTFEALDRRWGLLEQSGVSDRDRFLLDPELNARLGARWLADELLHRQNCVLIKELGHDCTRRTRSDPRLALVTSAAWFDPLADTRQQRVVLLALMEHSRGYTAVRGWLDRWRAERRDRDLEYMVETAGAAETRVLVRGVVTDASIVAAMGLFEPTP